MRVAAPHLVDSIVKFDEGVRKRAGRPVAAPGTRRLSCPVARGAPGVEDGSISTVPPQSSAIGLDAQVKSAGAPAKPLNQLVRTISSSAQLLKL